MSNKAAQELLQNSLIPIGTRSTKPTSPEASFLKISNVLFVSWYWSDVMLGMSNSLPREWRCSSVKCYYGSNFCSYVIHLGCHWLVLLVLWSPLQRLLFLLEKFCKLVWAKWNKVYQVGKINTNVFSTIPTEQARLPGNNTWIYCLN